MASDNVEGSTENATVATAVPSDLVECGLDPERDLARTTVPSPTQEAAIVLSV